jgi:hypothetical protein
MVFVAWPTPTGKIARSLTCGPTTCHYWRTSIHSRSNIFDVWAARQRSNAKLVYTAWHAALPTEIRARLPATGDSRKPLA